MARRMMPQTPCVLLFYDGPEQRLSPDLPLQARTLARNLYHKVSGRQRATGFRVAHNQLVKALRRMGCQVEVNNMALAAKNPDYPVGLTGYPSVLEAFPLSNPAILGPGLYDHPAENLNLIEDERIKAYIVHSEWYENLFKPYYGNRLMRWFAGIDLEDWPDQTEHPKSIDVLIYDKIRLSKNQEAVRNLPFLIEKTLNKRGLSFTKITYQNYNHDTYKHLLAQSRSMIFLSEHETQGFAYQEAMASNVPILAWDQGHWLDPKARLYEALPVPSSSVPFFNEMECGTRFRTLEDFPQALDRFWEKLETYQPRRFVERELSLETSAKAYLARYGALIPEQHLAA